MYCKIFETQFQTAFYSKPVYDSFGHFGCLKPVYITRRFILVYTTVYTAPCLKLPALRVMACGQFSANVLIYEYVVYCFMIVILWLFDVCWWPLIIMMWCCWWWLYHVEIFSCDQAALWMVQSVCLSVHHTFLTMFPSSYHHEIFRS